MSDSLFTKNAIAESLKKLSDSKMFDKITVSDIANGCGINRQTFYYHFQDKYELLSWIYYNELFLKVKEGLSFDNWDKKLEELLKAMKDEKHFYINTIKYSDEYFQEYLIKLAELVFEDAIIYLDKKNQVSDDEKEMFARFYAFGVCGTLRSWVLEGMKTSPEKLAAYMKKLAVSSLKAGNMIEE